ncbi:MAG: hypothetical protein IGS50_00730 [Synechococcales cyanobacterium C42_A2020_086]|jgi:hypothetical protein|nr:hypothetical protein [Synechococcales cyanobacterium C42_A2020_086]
MVAFIVGIIQALQTIAFLWGTQQAMQWWESRRVLRLNTEVEVLRDQVLQELFTMRRCLELVSLETGEAADQQRHVWLAQVETLHQSLERLGFQLSPPYVEDSLPLAIQALLGRIEDIKLLTGWKQTVMPKESLKTSA